MKTHLVSLVLIGLSLALPAQGKEKKKHVQLEMPKKIVVKAGTPEMIVVRMVIEKGFHVQANPASLSNLIPTTITFEAPEGVKIGAPNYPAPKMYRQQGAESDIATYETAADIRVPVTLPATSKKGSTVTLKGKLRYQACDEKTCLPPVNEPLQLEFVVD